MDHLIKRPGFLANLGIGLTSLLQGMKVTLSYFVRPSTIVTQQYPENRATLQIASRARMMLVMPHNAAGLHECGACKTCEMNCPNKSIIVTAQRNAVTNKKELERFVWRMDSCIYCNLCVMVCPCNAITMTNQFESAVYDRGLLVFTLNKYAGPDREEYEALQPDDRAKTITPINRYSGDVPLTGHAMPGLAGAELGQPAPAAAPAQAADDETECAKENP